MNSNSGHNKSSSCSGSNFKVFYETAVNMEKFHKLQLVR